ncbi:MAG: MFS transporter [Fimbriimonadaceae bacterium]|nr:MFS transporter [Fimbriimonadaceae bacterium]
MRAFRHRDFRLLWTGAFLSFMGSWIQNVAQGWLVYELTGQESMLALVTFFQSVPVSVLGPAAGAISDMFDKRKILIACQLIYSFSAIYLAFATNYGFVQYWHILAIALINGLTSTLEMPTRQSIVSRTVPPEDLSSAIPLQAMTFNTARLIGPSIGGLLLAKFGPSMCYGINGISYLALIFGVLAIRADLHASPREPQPIRDLVTEGMHFTWRDRKLRTLFIMEAIVSSFGLFYIAQMPAIAKKMLHLDEQGLGHCYTMVGVGAVVGLFVVSLFGDRFGRAMMVRVAMTSFAVGLLVMALARSPLVAFPAFAILGFSAIMQFNITNTLFQIIAPDRLRGRVLAMHLWALSGMSPFGTLVLGYVAQVVSIPVAFVIAGTVVLGGAVWGWTRVRVFNEVHASLVRSVARG